MRTLEDILLIAIGVFLGFEATNWLSIIIAGAIIILLLRDY